jgi:ribosomal protein S18 acetylase RimI-like enzyme
MRYKLFIPFLIIVLILKSDLSWGQTKIDTLELLSIGGIKQVIKIEGVNRKNPLFLFITGGPGSEGIYPENSSYLKELKKKFTVVTWDQRNCGQTLKLNASPVKLSVRELIDTEIAENRHYVLAINGVVASTFVLTLSDPLIWEDSDQVSAVYIHRIATGINFRGMGLLNHILKWLQNYAVSNAIEFIRLDTGAGNDSLINYYNRCGFKFLGNTAVNYMPDLPAHYKDGRFALFQMKA